MRSGEIFNGRFEIVGILGRGGMAVVYLARDQLRDEEVALKVVHPRLIDQPATRARLRREVATARQLHHPRAITPYDLHEGPDGLALSMPLHRGLTLEEHVHRDGSWSEAQLRGLLSDVAEVLEAAHRIGTIHRDLSPRNLLIDANGRTSVTDFGLSRSMESQTVTTQALGTPGFAAPESYEGVRTDPRLDLYGLGAVAWLAATGSPPFDAPGPAASLRLQLAGDLTPLSSLRPDLSLELIALIEALLSTQPSHRPAGATAILQILRGEAIVAAPRSSPPANSPLAPGVLSSMISTLLLIPAVYVLAWVAQFIDSPQRVPEPQMVAVMHLLMVVFGLPVAIYPAIRSRMATGLSAGWDRLLGLIVFTILSGIVFGSAVLFLRIREDDRVIWLMFAHALLGLSLGAKLLWKPLVSQAAPLREVAETPRLSAEIQQQLRALRGRLAPLPVAIQQDLGDQLTALEDQVERIDETLLRVESVLHQTEPDPIPLERLSRRIERLETLGEETSALRADRGAAMAAYERALDDASELSARHTGLIARLLEIRAALTDVQRSLLDTDDVAITGKLEQLRASATAAAAARHEVKTLTL